MTGLAVAALYWLPGAGLRELLWPDLRHDTRHDGLSRLAIAAALSLALRPLLELWAWTLGQSGGPALAWAPAGVGAAILVGRARQQRNHPSPHARRGAGVGWIDLFLVLVVGLTVASRWLIVRPLEVPAWGDSVQHTMIAQLMIEHGGLFQSWLPYAPIESLTYHFGFHATAAAWAQITGMGASDSVLWTGQVTGVVAVLALYPLALQLTDGKRVAGAGALLCAGLLFPMPAFYASWGRYTQLAGQAILPALVCTLDVIWLDRKRSPAGIRIVTGLLLAGLCLTHYRVALLAAAAMVVWPLASLWRLRANAGEWLVRAAQVLALSLASLLAVAPWLAVLDDGMLVSAHSVIAAIDPSAFSVQDAVRSWSSITDGVPWLAGAALLLALLLGLLARSRAVALLLAWSAASLLLTNPFVIGLPGMGFVTNFAIGIAAYIPAAVLLGWTIAQAVPWAESRRGGRAVLVAILVLAALVGFDARAEPVARHYRLLTSADLDAFEWIRNNTPPGAHFQVETAMGYGGRTPVGTDGGWWLPLFAGRTSTLPPLTHVAERMRWEDRNAAWTGPIWYRRGRRWPHLYRKVLCAQGATHLYLGDRRGSVGGDGEPMLVEEVLERDPAMARLHTRGRAQVWQFDRSVCEPQSPAP